MRWRDYQENVTALFPELDCDAEVGAQVPGAKSGHKVDIWVTFHRFGLKHSGDTVFN